MQHHFYISTVFTVKWKTASLNPGTHHLKNKNKSYTCVSEDLWGFGDLITLGAHQQVFLFLANMYLLHPTFKMLSLVNLEYIFHMSMC